MTVQQLKEKLANFPDHWDIWLYRPDEDFTYVPLEAVCGKDIPLSEDPDGPALAHEEVVALYALQEP
jgi:hypothetical protein